MTSLASRVCALFGMNRSRPNERSAAEITSYPSIDSIAAPDDYFGARTDMKSVLSPSEVVNKIRGTLFGAASGDAVGLYCEFKPRSQCVEEYGEGASKKPIELEREVRGWKRGDWTDDTDQQILILDTILAARGSIDGNSDAVRDFAARLLYWCRCGFSELGDAAGLGIGNTVGAVVFSDNFLTQPHETALAAWKAAEGRAAANGALMRTSVLGLLHWSDLQRVTAQTKAIALVTHADPRCVASCVVQTTAIALILQGQTDMESVIAAAVDSGVRVLHEVCRIMMAVSIDDGEPLTDARVAHFESDLRVHCSAADWSDLSLGKPQTIGYTYKCLGAAILALRLIEKGRDFRFVITALVLEGGDADTNAAVAGALIGCRLGYDLLDKKWCDDLLHGNWLNARINRLVSMLGLPTAERQPQSASEN